MTPPADLDHTSFAVRDALTWAQRLRRELGATPIAGETLPDFRYLLMYVGTAQAGGRIELIEPTGHGFLTRHLDRRGEGPHHITFTVPDLPAAVARARDLGATVTGEDYSHPSWQEAFIAPDHIHRTVIQLAHSDTAYPRPGELLGTTARNPAAYPSSKGATDPTWWHRVWDTPVGHTAVLGATHLGSTDPDFSRRLFEDVLGADTRVTSHGIEFRWASGTLRVHPAATAGVTAVDLLDAPPDALWIGATTLAASRW